MSDPQPRETDRPAAVVTAVTAAILSAYAAAQVDLIAKFASLIRRYKVGDLLLSQMRKTAKASAADLAKTTPDLVSELSDQSSQDGFDAAGPGEPVRSTFGVAGDSFESHAERSARAIREDLDGKLNQLGYRLNRYADDVYRAVVADAAQSQALGEVPTAAQHRAYTQLVKRGVDGFTDAKGRKWELSAYVEMATRTAAQRAFNVSHLDRMQALGVDLFTVPGDGHPCPLCLPWEGAVLSVTPDPRAQATIAEATAAGLFHPRCFPGFVKVASPTGVGAADSRWYDGELIVINTASGDELSVTPNHPVLTPEGWVAAGDLVVGQSVLRYNGDAQRVDDVRPNDEHVVARIGDVFHALRQASGVTSVSVPASAEQFHGDGSDGDVEVVLVDGLLGDGFESQVGEGVADSRLFVGGVDFAELVRERSLDQDLVRLLGAPDGIVSGGGDLSALLRRHAAHSAAHRFAQVGADVSAQKPSADDGLAGSEVLANLTLSHASLAHSDGLGDLRSGFGPFSLEGKGFAGLAGDSSGSDLLRYPSGASAEDGRELGARLAGLVSADQIVDVDRREFSGHVYNLESGDGWYVAESIVVHNCRHTLAGYFPGVTETPEPHTWTPEDQKRYAESQQQRALERRIRAAKRVEAGALTPDMARDGRAQVRAAQAAMREFIARTGRVRISHREQLQ